MKTINYYAALIYVFLLPALASGQGVVISTNQSQPDPSAILDIKSTDKGLLVPRLTTLQREGIVNPAEGLMVYDSTERKFVIFHSGEDKWKPLASSEELLWEYDSLSNTIYLINDSARVGIGTSTPGSTLDVDGDIRSSLNMKTGPDGSINYKLDESGDTIPGIFRNPLNGWMDFPYYPSQSMQIATEKAGHDSVGYIIPNPESGSEDGPGANFFVIYQEFMQDSLDMELWLYMEMPSLLLGLLTLPVNDEEPLWVAAINPLFEDDPTKSTGLYARYDSVAGSDTISINRQIGLASINSWSHYRLAWKKSDYFRIWINGTQVTDLPGSNITPEALAIGGFGNMYLDAVGLSTNGYQPLTNLGTGKSIAKIGVFDAIFAKNLPATNGLLPITGGTLTGNLYFTPSYQDGDDQDYSRSQLQLTSVDSLGNEKGELSLSSQTYVNNNNTYTREEIYGEGQMEITSNNNVISFTFDSLNYDESNLGPRYMAELSSTQGWGYRGFPDCAGLSVYINDNDTVSVNHPISITGFHRDNHEDADSIMIAYDAQEDYSSWKYANVMIIEGSELSYSLNISSTVQDDENVWLIMQDWVSVYIDSLDIGNEFIVIRYQGYGIGMNSQYNTWKSNFEQTIFSSSNLSLNSGGELSLSSNGKLTLGAGNNDINVSGNNISFNYGGVTFIKDTVFYGFNVGIGTSLPEEKLSIHSGCIYLGQNLPLYTSNRLYNYSGNLYWNGYQISGTNGVLPSGSTGQTLYYNGTAWTATSDLTITSSNVGIGTSTTNSKLTVAGLITPSSDNSYDIGSSSYRWGNIYATNGTIQTSDKRFKKNIIPVDSGLEYVMKFKPVVFEWKDRTDKKHFGLIAQDVDQWISKSEYSVVNEGDDPDHKLGINYSEIVPLLIKSVQELKTENDELRKELKMIRMELDQKD